MTHKTIEELNAGLDAVRESPRDRGTVVWMTRRPDIDQREVLETGEFVVDQGLAGDNWGAREQPKHECQVTVMNARSIAAIDADQDRWALAGDQLFVDFDLSLDNLPPGSRLHVGTAILEVSERPHNGCKKFHERFGADALRWVNSEAGKQLRLRGLNAKVVQSGVVARGDAMTRE